MGTNSVQVISDVNVHLEGVLKPEPPPPTSIIVAIVEIIIIARHTVVIVIRSVATRGSHRMQHKLYS